MYGKLYAGARAALNLTVAQFAEGSGVSQSAIRNIEGDSSDNGKKALSAFLEGQGIVVDEALGLLTIPSPESDDNLAKVVAVARAICGFSQRALAGLTGVSLRTINGIETSAATPTTANRDTLLTAFERHGLRFSRDHASEVRMVFRMVQNSDVDDDVDAETIAGEDDDFPVIDPSKERPELFRLRVELKDLKPVVWREILIPRNATFHDLHVAIMIAFGWGDKYTHSFRCGLTVEPFYEPDYVDAVGGVDERLVRIDQIYFRTNAFVYRYGKGEHWIATVSMTGREPGTGQPTHPTVTAGEGAGMPEEAWVEDWNTMARELRKGKAKRETLDWLHYLGYGRDYDPDHLDLDAINREFAEANFDIPSTWEHDFQRRQKISKLLAKVLPTKHPKRPERPRVAKSEFKIVKSEPMGENDLIFDHKHGLSINYPKKSGGHARWRSTHHKLSRVLEYAPDVESFGTFPLAIHWIDKGAKGVFQPDLKVKCTSGAEFYLHIAYDEEEAKFATAIASKLELDMHVIGNGFHSELMVSNCNEVESSTRWMKEHETDGLVEALGSTALKQPILMGNAIRDLAGAGFGREVEGFTAGNPEGRTLARVLLAVTQGKIGMDFSRPLKKTVIGPKHLTSDSVGLSLLIEEYGVASTVKKKR